MEKTLLILGGTAISQQIVYTARELGMKVMVTDYNEDSPCKKIADKSFMASCTDEDAIVQLIQQEHIDGVITGYTDSLLPSYIRICEKAGLPCYANRQAVEIITDKDLFKEACHRSGVSVVPEYTLSEVNRGEAIYPLIIKPVDNSGARGIFICADKKEFDAYYPQALQFSRSRHVLIERYIEEKEATIFYYLHQGEAYLLGVSDRHMLKHHEKLLPLPIGYTFPSTHQKDYINLTDPKVKNIFKELEMKEGLVFLQAFNKNGQFMIYEAGYRLTGSLEHYLIGKAHGFHPLKALLLYAVGEQADFSPIKKADLDAACTANVTLLLSEGTISHYEGLEEAKRMPGVLHIHPSYPVGAVIDSNIIGKLAQVGVRILLHADNRTQLLERMDAVKDAIRVISTDHKDMSLKGYSYQEICRS